MTHQIEPSKMVSADHFPASTCVVNGPQKSCGNGVGIIKESADLNSLGTPNLLQK